MLHVRRDTLVSLIFVLAALSLAFYKIDAGVKADLEISPQERSYDYGAVEEKVIFSRDEIKYLTWNEHRTTDLDGVIRRIRGGTPNLWGVAVSSVYELTGSWRVTLLLFATSTSILFSISCVLLLRALNLPDTYLAIAFLCPTVLALASSLLRDLFVIAAVNFAFLGCLRRTNTLTAVALVAVFFTRAMYIPLLAPILLYLRSGMRFQKSRYSIAICICATGLFLLLLLRNYEPIYGTSSFDVLLRVLSATTGLNKALIDVPNQFLLHDFLEYSGLLYQAFTSLALMAIITYSMQMSRFASLVYVFCIALGILYGYQLGFFVGRTRLICFWLSLLAIGLYLSRTPINSDGNAKYRF